MSDVAPKKTGVLSRMFGGKDTEAPEEATSSSADEKSDVATAVQEPGEIALDKNPAPTDTADAENAGKGGWFSRLRTGLSRTSSRLSDGVTGIFSKRKLDDDTIEELEDLLIQADLGIATSSRITDALAADRFDKAIAPEEVLQVLAGEIARVLEPVAKPLQLAGTHRPEVVLMVGVNGTGKTTTIGKLTAKFRADGKSVMLAAGDTFRAAAVEQLKVWGERTGTEVVTRDLGADAAGLAFDALTQARDTGTDVLMIDTAGRLQNKADLMSELEKIIRVIRKIDEAAPHHVLLVLDATTGQNALQQVEIFGKMAGVTGLIMTKLDGTARGGILVAIAEAYGLPIHAIGVGEGIYDLQPFEPRYFAEALAGLRTHT